MSWFRRIAPLVFLSLQAAASAADSSGIKPADNSSPLTTPPAVVKMESFEVKTNQAAILNSIDRKIYNVGKDVSGATGSVSNLLQNVPSVQVDIDGNVSLRGDSSVLILIDGKPSAMMSAGNRADVLEQMPADSIESIEVITNPSAKFEPDGTGGIINLTLKRQKLSGYSGSVRASVGNSSRYNISASGNYHPGKYNLNALASLRQDDRPRYTTEVRSHIDAATGASISTVQNSVEHSRPLSRLVQFGGNYSPTKKDKLDLTLQYNFRTFKRSAITSNLTRDAAGGVTSDYDRLRIDPEWQKTQSVDGSWQHTFTDEGHELSLNAKRERHWEQEDNHYTNVYRYPATAAAMESILLKPTETTTELSTVYNRPLLNEAKLETGYTYDDNGYDTDQRGGLSDPTSGASLLDPARTNRFIYQNQIHAVFGTYGRAMGEFAFLGGLRFEQTHIDTDQVTSRQADHQDYGKLHPSLHLTYNLSETQQVQLNYSHRIRRPESDDLNPFPEYQDPFNLRAGNPRLLPSETHSLEAGYQYRLDDTTYSATLYYRNTQHSFTQLTRYIDSTTLLTTQENLGKSQSGGLEVTASRTLGAATVNFSGNAYRNQIDASNLGQSSSRSTMTWEAKLNVSYHVSKSTQAELNSNYTATRLTAQGERRPTYVTNIGLKHDLADRRFSLILTLSDVFNSLRERSIIDTPTLHDDTVRRRSARIIYAGFIYNFGRSNKKSKDDSLKFDNAL